MPSLTIGRAPVSRMGAVDNLRAAAPQIGMAMGVFFFIVGMILGNFGIVGLGFVVGLTGFFARDKG